VASGYSRAPQSGKLFALGRVSVGSKKCRKILRSGKTLFNLLLNLIFILNFVLASLSFVVS
jgi:hypothetical protein